MASLTLSAKDPVTVRADAVVLAVAAGANGPRLIGAEALPAELRRSLTASLVPLGVTGAADGVHRVPTAGALAAPVLVLTGVGRVGSGALPTETLRRAAGAATRSLAGLGTVALALPVPDAAAIGAVAEGALLGAYAFDRYRSTVVAENGRRPQPVRGVIVLTAAARGGYGGLLGVGKGSARPPRLVRLDYAPAGAVAHLAYVGKGITFDSGGLSIKPAAGMEAMKSDMSGAAAVLGTVTAAARLGLPVRVTGWLALAENMPSGSAIRPSDVLTARGGRTIEVLNTDAEGRLVLADAIVAAGEENPDLIVDVATLTGAQMVALGNRVSAIMSNDDRLRERVHRVAESVGEQFWPMPLPPELRPSMDSQVADIANLGERYGGMLVAGLFLAEFVPDLDAAEGEARKVPWAHLDIAGPAFNTGSAHDYTPVGGTGVAVRTLIGLLEDVATGGL